MKSMKQWILAVILLSGFNAFAMEAMPTDLDLAVEQVAQEAKEQKLIVAKLMEGYEATQETLEPTNLPSQNWH